MHTRDIIDMKTIPIRSCQCALLAIEPTSLHFFISKEYNHVQRSINKITFLCTPYMLFFYFYFFINLTLTKEQSFLIRYC